MASRSLQGSVKGYRVIVNTHGGDSGEAWTRYRVTYRKPLGLGLNLTPPHMLSGVAKFLGSQDLEIGDSSFDDAVVVKGREAKRIAAFLTPSRRRRIHRLLSEKYHCVVDDRGVEWSEEGLASNANILISNIQAGVSAAQHLGAADDTGQEKELPGEEEQQ